MTWGMRAVAVMTAILLGAGVAVAATAPSSDLEQRSVAPKAPLVPAARPMPSPTTLPAVVSEPAPSVAVEPEAAPVVPPAVATPPKPWKLMLIGDSMAFTAGLGLAPEAPAWDFTVGNEGINGCGVVRGGPYRYFGAEHHIEPRCEAWPSAWSDALARNQPHMVAIVVGRWELMDRMFEGRWTNLFDPAFAAYVESELDAAVVLAGSTGARVVVFTSPYYQRGIPPGGGLFPEDDPARVDVINGLLRRVAERHGAAVVDVGAWLSPHGQYTREVGGVRVRSDGVHLTRQAGRLLAPWLFPQLQAAMAGVAPE